MLAYHCCGHLTAFTSMPMGSLEWWCNVQWRHWWHYQWRRGRRRWWRHWQRQKNIANPVDDLRMFSLMRVHLKSSLMTSGMILVRACLVVRLSLKSLNHTYPCERWADNNVNCDDRKVQAIYACQWRHILYSWKSRLYGHLRIAIFYSADSSQTWTGCCRRLVALLGKAVTQLAQSHYHQQSEIWVRLILFLKHVARVLS